MLKIGLLRKWSGTLFASLLMLAVLVPVIDTFVCVDDTSGKPAVTSIQGKAVASKELPVQQHDDGDSSCIHGHCHHWVGVPRVSERVAFVTSAKRATPILAAYEQRSSAPPFELLRPPRA